MDKLTVRHILLTLLEEWLEMTLKFKKKEFNGDTRDLRTMDIIAHAEAALNEIYKPMSKEEIGEKLAQAYCLANHSHKILDPSLIREQVKLLYPHLRLSEAQINEVLPKKKEILPLSTDYRFGKSTQHSLWSYNQAIDDCKQALLNLGKGGGENGNIKQG